MLVSSAYAARGEKKEEPIPRYYNEKTKKQFSGLAFEELSEGALPFTDEQLEELSEILRKRDYFIYGQEKELEIKNARFSVTPGKDKIIKVNLGHTYNTTIVFTDSLGNPWGFETLTDASNLDALSYVKPVSNIINVKPKIRAGQANIPIKLNGVQSPLTILFNIGSDEVFFNADVSVEGLGDSPASQRRKSMGQYASGVVVDPKLTEEPSKELMLQFLTPDGFTQRELFDEYGQKVDSRDFVAWSKGGRLFVMTPHSHYTPEPIDVSAASDGRHKLLEYPDQSVLLLRKDSKIIMLHIR